ncbi:MAG: beta,2-mannobiose phosphorylase / 1,2-beta-oligomannan phosphorylase [Patescibacteria group bacterium]|nr:beta,2-mannobiose phosphorylase / 1,2-beta-oligomannan phosphorylase [Patescibacteria group bacterium]
MFNVKRIEENPILSPKEDHPWEALATFNGCPVLEDDGTVHMVYRAMSHPDLMDEKHLSISVVGRAVSKDGIHFSSRHPFIVPEHDFERFGCEDPRITKLDGKYYTFYTGISEYPFVPEGIRVALAISRNLQTVDEKHLITPFNAKAMALFPEKVNGKFVALLTPNTDLPPSEIAIAYFDKEEDMWNESYWNEWYKHLKQHIIPLRRREDDQVELGAQPLKTKDGWLVIYSHILHYTDQSRRTFGIEAVLLDLENPQKIIGRTARSFLTPEAYYETTGMIPRIVFPSGAVIKGDFVELYYGGADTHCAKAKIHLPHLLAVLKGEIKLFERAKENPILAPREGKDWEALGVFNPAAVDIDDTVHIYYRAATKTNVSTIGHATAKDGIHIDFRTEEPIYKARTEEEGIGRTEYAGCEDPRIVRIEDMLYMTYTGYNGKQPRVALSTISVNDFKENKYENWSLPIAISPMGVDDKDACLVPKKFKNGYLIFHRVAHHLCADYIETLDFTKERLDQCIDVFGPRPGMWDGLKVGIAGPPLETEKGWILFYHGISELGEYRMGAVLLDKDDPTIVIGRTASPLFEPEEEYEKAGIVPNVVFPCGNLVRGDKVYIYYGGADYVVGVATASLHKLLDILTH